MYTTNLKYTVDWKRVARTVKKKAMSSAEGGHLWQTSLELNEWKISVRPEEMKEKRTERNYMFLVRA